MSPRGGAPPERPPGLWASSEAGHWMLRCLEMLAGLGGELPGDPGSDAQPAIFAATRTAAERVLPLRAMAFLTVDADLDFQVAESYPPEATEAIRDAVAAAVDEGTFGWAVSQSHLVVTRGTGAWPLVVLHSLATRTRVLGAFVGFLDANSPVIPEVERKLLSVVFHYCAAALETSLLYRELEVQAQEVERKVAERTADLRRAERRARERDRAEGASPRAAGAGMPGALEGPGRSLVAGPGTPDSPLVAPRAPSVDLGGLRVLVVEDDPMSQRVSARILEKLGCTVDVAADGLEALEHFGRRRYDAIFMDCRMPDMDGYQATAEIRAREGDELHTPIIAVTAAVSEGDRERCLDAGMDDYLGKPVRQADLRRVLERWTRTGSDG